MTSGNACHHMNAARILKEIPAIEEKVANGTIAMSTVAQAEAFFKREARAGNKFDTEKKQKLLSELETKSTREADKILIATSLKPEIHFKEKLTQKTESIVEARLHLDDETIELLSRLKEIWSHALPNANFAALIKRAAKEAVAKNDPLERAKRSDARVRKGPNARKNVDHVPIETSASFDPGLRASKTSAVGTPSPGFGKAKAEVRRAVWLRDLARCTFVDSRTGERCGAKHFVEEDHIQPKAMGGEYSVANIRLRCRTHNQRHAINCYGIAKMREYVN